MDDLINIDDFEAAARASLPKMAYDYYASGAHDQLTLWDNMRAFDRCTLIPRVLVDISHRNMTTTVLGQHLDIPIMIAPTAFHGMAHAEGERATARAASAAGSLMIVSTLANTRLEDIAAEASCPLWFQLYVYKDRAATAELVKRAEAAGYGAIVLTVDAQLWGVREADVRNRFCLPPGLAIKNLPSGMENFPADVEDSGLAAYVASQLDPALSWQDVAWLRSLTDLPIVLKGIVHPDDAVLAAEHGASAIIVSNHGGRQLDTAPATLDALPAIAEAVGGELELYLDGGIRRGTDVLKALALGAKAVAIGRPALWGLAAGGEAGVCKVLNILAAELELAMGLCGCTSAAQVSPDLVQKQRLGLRD